MKTLSEAFRRGGGPKQATLRPDCMDEYVTGNNPVHVIEALVDDLDLAAQGFAGVAPEAIAKLTQKARQMRSIQ